MSDPTALWPPFTFPEECAGCPLAGRARAFVPGYGPLDARLVLVLERPGGNEEREGRPTVGATGRDIARALGLREPVELDGVLYRTNVRKCVVEDESKAEKERSIRHCAAAYLAREFEALTEARCVVAVGADAAGVLVGRWETAEARKNLMGKLHGTAWARGEVDRMRVQGENAP